MIMYEVTYWSQRDLLTLIQLCPRSPIDPKETSHPFFFFLIGRLLILSTIMWDVTYQVQIGLSTLTWLCMRWPIGPKKAYQP